MHCGKTVELSNPKRMETHMTQQSQDLRTQALERVLAGATTPASGVESLIRAWLNSLEEEDLAGLAAECLASPLWEGFSRLAKWTPQEGCRIEALSYADGRGGQASALLILNQDMPFLVDSMVMAMRRMRMPSRAVLNAVLSVQRGADGGIQHADKAGRITNGGDAFESYVLCLMSEQLGEQDLTDLLASMRLAAGDAATVRRDAAALREKMSQVAVAAAARDATGQEVAAFLEWAKSEGFEAFGYARYQIVSGQRELVREPGSAIGVLIDKFHPVYGNCLAGIPGDFDTLAARKDTLSVVKADVQSTLHRDQQLDFIGVRARRHPRRALLCRPVFACRHCQHLAAAAVCTRSHQAGADPGGRALRRLPCREIP
jgi:glutamate dehydrogenase